VFQTAKQQKVQEGIHDGEKGNVSAAILPWVDRK
jgi:hypothetical protein